MNYRGDCGREGVGRMEWSEGGKWDNRNSIINKYILKKEEKGSLLEMRWNGRIDNKEVNDNVHYNHVHILNNDL